MRSFVRSLAVPAAVFCMAVALAFPALPVHASGSYHSHSLSDDDGAWLMSGTWSGGRDSEHPDRLYLSLECRNDAQGSHSQWGRVETGDIDGLDLRALGTGRTPVDFRVRRFAPCFAR